MTEKVVHMRSMRKLKVSNRTKVVSMVGKIFDPMAAYPA